MSITLQIFSAKTSLSEPPKTVKSWEKTKTLRPKIVAVAGDDRVAVRAAIASSRSSTRGGGRSGRARRTSPGRRASRRALARGASPRSRCRATAFSLPAWSACSRSSSQPFELAAVVSCVIGSPLRSLTFALVRHRLPPALRDARIRAPLDRAAHEWLRDADDGRRDRLAGLLDPPPPARPRARRAGGVPAAAAPRAAGGSARRSGVAAQSGRRRGRAAGGDRRCSCSRSRQPGRTRSGPSSASGCSPASRRPSARPRSAR